MIISPDHYQNHSEHFQFFIDAPPSPPSSPQPDKVDKVEQSHVTSSPDSHTVSPVADVRGPRIKHVCRKAAVVLGKTIARFPESELTLSALPKVEKKKILRQDELDKAGGIKKVLYYLMLIF